MKIYALVASLAFLALASSPAFAEGVPTDAPKSGAVSATGGAPQADDADATKKLSPGAREILARMRSSTAESRRAELKKSQEMERQMANMNASLSSETREALVGMKARFAELRGLCDQIDAAKAAKDDKAAAELDRKLVDKSVEAADFIDNLNKKLNEHNAPPGGPLAAGADAPALKVKIVSGDQVETDLSKIKDKVVVVEFWATWCAPCRESIPKINALWKKFKDKAEFIGITEGDEAGVKSFVAKQKEMAYSVAMDSGDVAKAYKVSGIPIAFIIVNGKIVWSGYPWAGLDKAVEAAVADPKKAFEDAVAAGKTKAADKAGDKDND